MTLHLRYQGRVSGPFTLEQVQTMQRRGQVTRLHQVSEDRVAWVRVCDYPPLGVPQAAAPSPAMAQMQAQAATQAAQTQAAPAPAGAPQPAAAAPLDDLLFAPETLSPQVKPTQAAPNAPADPMDEMASAAQELWHYATDDGALHGPVPRRQLVQAIEQGKLKPTVRVWKEGMEDWVEAKEVLKFGRTKQEDHTAAAAIVFGAIGAAIMALAIVGTIITPQPEGVRNITVCAIHFLLFLACAIAAPLVPAKARGITLLSVAGFSLLLSPIGWTLVAPCMALLHGNLAYRSGNPDRPGARTFGIVASAVNLFLFIVAGLILLVAWASVVNTVRHVSGQVGFTVGMIVLAIPALCGLLASIFSLTEALQGRASGMNMAGRVLLVLAFFLPTAVLVGAPLVAGLSFGNGEGALAGGILATTMALLAAVFCCQLALLRTGLLALLRGTE